MSLDQIIAFAILAIFPLCVTYATFSDLLGMRISNVTCGVLVASFYLLAPMAGIGWETMAIHTGIALGVLVFGMSLWSLGAMGGGDAKLIAAVTLWLGLLASVWFIFLASLIGFVVTIAFVGLRCVRRRLPMAVRRPHFMRKLLRRKVGIPYGLALGPAALVLFSISPWVNLAARNGLG